MSAWRVHFCRLSACCVLYAAVGAQALASDIEIEADSIEYNHDTGNSTYFGNVVIKRDDMRLTGKRVEIFTDDGKVHRIVAEGRPATCRNDLEEQDTVYIEAERIDYDDRTEIMNLYSNVVLDYDGNVLRGERIVYNLKTRQIKVPKGRKRVRLTIPAADTGSDS